MAKQVSKAVTRRKAAPAAKAPAPAATRKAAPAAARGKNGGGSNLDKALALASRPDGFTMSELAETLVNRQGQPWAEKAVGAFLWHIRNHIRPTQDLVRKKDEKSGESYYVIVKGNASTKQPWEAEAKPAAPVARKAAAPVARKAAAPVARKAAAAPAPAAKVIRRRASAPAS